MQHKLKALKNYQKMDRSNDLVQLLKEIKFFSNKIEENTSIYKALHDAKTRLYLYKQKEDESLEDHIHNFKDLVGTIEHYWGAFSMINNSHSTKQIRIKNKDKRC